MGTLKVDNLQKRDGTALITDGAASTTLLSQASLRSAGVGMILLKTTDVTSATASVDFNSSLITDTYDKYIMSYQGVKPVNDTVYLRSRYSTDNGSTFETGTFSYGYQHSKLGGTATGGAGDTSSNYAENNWGAGNDANYPYNGTFHIDALRDSSTYLSIRHEFIFRDSSNNQYVIQEGWTLSNAVTYNYIEFSFSSGNIADGTFTLYGMAK